MKGVRSPVPTRRPSGFSTDPPHGPLADFGLPCEFFYHYFTDDFDNNLGTANAGTLYTITSSGAGSVVHTPGDGGNALFTTGALVNNFESIQLPAASFQLPLTGAAPPGTLNDTRKMFYLARASIGHTTDSLILGLTNTSATPFTTGVQSVVDGLFLYKPPASTTLQILNIASAANSPTGSAISQTFNVPFTFAANTSYDFAFYIDSYQNLKVWAATQLIGYIPNSGSGATGVGGVSALPVIGPLFANYNFQAMFANSNIISTQNIPMVFSTANLNLTAAISNGTTAAATTMNLDFHMASKER